MKQSLAQQRQSVDFDSDSSRPNLDVTIRKIETRLCKIKSDTEKKEYVREALNLWRESEENRHRSLSPDLIWLIDDVCYSIRYLCVSLYDTNNSIKMYKLKDFEFCLDILDIAFDNKKATPTRKAHVIDHVLRSWTFPEFQMAKSTKEKNETF